MNKNNIVTQILGDLQSSPVIDTASAFAPANIALCKYWGKRDEELNLPYNSSLSISLGELGAHTTVALRPSQDEFSLNAKAVALNSEFAQKLKNYLDLFRPPQTYFHIATTMNIPVAAGLASSACGFAALIKALNQLMGWQLADDKLSILARLGSGSACRSLWQGFVVWQKGEALDGMDSVASLLPWQWPALRIGILMISEAQKKLSSRLAMQQTVKTSPLYFDWVKLADQDIPAMLAAIKKQDFLQLGFLSESNALAMHDTMQSAHPAINYSLPDTLAAREKIWQLREQGLPVFFTQDAGPNLKLLFLEEDEAAIQTHFPSLRIVAPFAA